MAESILRFGDSRNIHYYHSQPLTIMTPLQQINKYETNQSSLKLAFAVSIFNHDKRIMLRDQAEGPAHRSR